MLDTTDLIILVLVTLGTLAYFSKGKLWAKPAQVGYGYGASGKGAANGVAKPKKTRNIVERMDQQNKNVVVFFGSQTGTAGMFPPPSAQILATPILTCVSRGLFFPSRQGGPFSLWTQHDDC